MGEPEEICWAAWQPFVVIFWVCESRGLRCESSRGVADGTRKQIATRVNLSLRRAGQELRQNHERLRDCAAQDFGLSKGHGIHRGGVSGAGVLAGERGRGERGELLQAAAGGVLRSLAQ